MGSIEVICGSMFSGKTEELIKRIQELHNTNLNYKVFKPEIDKRSGDNKIQSHSKKSIDAINIKDVGVSHSSFLLGSSSLCYCIWFEYYWLKICRLGYKFIKHPLFILVSNVDQLAF